MGACEVSITAILTALAIALALFPLQYPFPPLSFLKFDIAELPVMIVSVMLGPVYAFISSIILGLAYVSRDPIGAIFKTLAILSMALPISSAVYIMPKIKNKRLGIYMLAIFSVIIRSACMTLADYVLIPIIYTPGIPLETVASWFGMSLGVFLWFIFLFNILQGLINIIPGVVIVLSLPKEWAPEWLRSSE